MERGDEAGRFWLRVNLLVANGDDYRPSASFDDIEGIRFVQCNNSSLAHVPDVISTSSSKRVFSLDDR
ncbi:hypothetical protein BN2476_240207 [Paraburkholderia piptadeniae]|uniref:Uncharacterized protein n=1 Tax=Paraburkholderia piptadeniae TaxID=1701573 RepID=A0A1N7RZG6_9BURK|nr:hypothetical protein BN2476_240207 [Paraburkholderia piptadeniae]